MTGIKLSIPIIWDFSLKRITRSSKICLPTTFNSHHMGFLIETDYPQVTSQQDFDFQFPSYGISHWNQYLDEYGVWPKEAFNSHHMGFLIETCSRFMLSPPWVFLSIPIIWDFSLKLYLLRLSKANEILLSIPIIWDFSLKPSPGTIHKSSPLVFQFPSYGISHWNSKSGDGRTSLANSTFNSHHMGFLIETKSVLITRSARLN